MCRGRDGRNNARAAALYREAGHRGAATPLRVPGVTDREAPPKGFERPATDAETWGFAVAAIALSVGVFALHQALGYEALYGTPTGPLVLWAPTIVGVMAALLTHRGMASLGLGASPWRYHALAFAVPAASLLAVDGTLLLAGVVRFSGGVQGLQWGLVPINLFEAAGEEIGFRGWLVPALASRYGFRKAALASSAAWFVWHLPGAIWGDFGQGAPAIYGIACFGVFAMGFGVFLAWLRTRSGSVWPAVVAHAAHNAVLYGVLQHTLVDAQPIAPWLRGELGAPLAVLAVVIGLVCLRRAPEPARP